MCRKSGEISLQLDDWSQVSIKNLEFFPEFDEENRYAVNFKHFLCTGISAGKNDKALM